MNWYLRNPSVKKGIDTRKIPYAPTFKRTPANKMLPAVGASTWASGNHVWRGKRGTFIRKPNVNNKNNISDCLVVIYIATIDSKSSANFPDEI